MEGQMTCRQSVSGPKILFSIMVVLMWRYLGVGMNGHVGMNEPGTSINIAFTCSRAGAYNASKWGKNILQKNRTHKGASPLD